MAFLVTEVMHKGDLIWVFDVYSQEEEDRVVHKLNDFIGGGFFDGQVYVTESGPDRKRIRLDINLSDCGVYRSFICEHCGQEATEGAHIHPRSPKYQGRFLICDGCLLEAIEKIKYRCFGREFF